MNSDDPRSTIESLERRVSDAGLANKAERGITAVWDDPPFTRMNAAGEPIDGPGEKVQKSIRIRFAEIGGRARLTYYEDLTLLGVDGEMVDVVETTDVRLLVDAPCDVQRRALRVVAPMIHDFAG